MSHDPGSRSYDTLVFDFYGTLAHAPEFHFEAALDALLGKLDPDLERRAFASAYGRQVERYFREVAARGDEQHNTAWIAGALCDLGRPTEPHDPDVVAAVSAYFALYERQIVALPRVAETLAVLAESFRLGLLSNFTDARPVRGALARHDLTRHFEAIVISAEIGRRKPHRDAFEHALRSLGSTASRALYVGDDPEDDVLGAAGAGMHVAWVQSPLCSRLARRSSSEWSVERAAEIASYRLAGIEDLVELLAAPSGASPPEAP